MSLVQECEALCAVPTGRLAALSLAESVKDEAINKQVVEEEPETQDVRNLFKLPPELRLDVYEYVNPSGTGLQISVNKQAQPTQSPAAAPSLLHDGIPVFEGLLPNYNHNKHHREYTQLHRVNQQLFVEVLGASCDSVTVDFFVHPVGGKGKIPTQQAIFDQITRFSQNFSPASRGHLTKLHLGPEDLSRFFRKNIHYYPADHLPEDGEPLCAADLLKRHLLLSACEELSKHLPNITSITLHDRQVDRLGDRGSMFAELGKNFPKLVELRVLSLGWGIGGYKPKAEKYLVGPGGCLLNGKSGKRLY